MKNPSNFFLTSCASALLLGLLGSPTHAQTRELLWRVDQAVTLPSRAAYFGPETAGPIDFRPSFQLNRVVATNNASFVAVPINTADIEVSNALTVAPPSIQGTRSWQVFKLDANGALLWKRQILSISSRISDFKLTAEGGVALLQNRQLSVFGPNGEVRFSADVVNELCLDKGGNPNGIPHRMFLTDDESLVVGYAGSGSETARACAYNYQGNLLSNITSVLRLEVGDFRKNVGFLIKEGDFIDSTWSNARFELRNENQVYWSKSVADEENIPRTAQIAVGGSTWLRIGIRFQRIETNGAIEFDIAALDYQNVGFFDSSRVLLSNPAASRVAAINANGSAAWVIQQPLWSDVTHPPIWQIGAENTRVLGYLNADRRGIIRNISSASGIETSSISAVLPQQRAIFAFGSLAGVEAISIDSSLEPLVFPTPSAVFCPGGGFCPASARVGTPTVRRYSVSSNLISELSAPELTFALPTRPLERRPAAQLVGSAGQTFSALHVGYRHDGFRQQLVVQNVRADGQVLWQQTLSTPRYDAEKASFAINGSTVLISATESFPGSTVGTLWELRLGDGLVLNTHTTPALQALNVIGGKACSLTSEALTRLLCLVPTQIPQVRAITGAPAAAANLLDYGRSGDQLRARIVDGVNSQFQFANINADAVYSAGATLAFQSSPGAFPLRTDRVQTLANGETLASARLNDSSNGNALFASAIALFATDGTRIWQTQINEPQRDYQPSTQSSLNTVMARASNGDIYVGLQARANTPLGAPVRICRLSAAGVQLGCSTAPKAGRVVALMQDPDSNGILVWLRGNAGNTTASSLSTQIFAFDGSLFSAQQFNLSQSVALAADSFTPDGDSVYAVLGTLNNFGVVIDRADGQLSLVKIALGSDAIFQNGFEDE